MKLRNKKTGEVGELQITEKHCAVAVGNGTASCGIVIYNSLAELNADWEDYEEPKGKWFISNNGQIHNDEEHERFREERKQIGNYFETEEEAEKAVEKLKAWKRLKDNGFEFDGIRLEGSNCLIKTKLKDNTGVTFDHAQQFYEDVDLLFGGEE